jgi:hypothetical protein
MAHAARLNASVPDAGRTGATQPHCGDQLGMYAHLVYATPELQAGGLPKYQQVTEVQGPSPR